jgi:glycosyltransferase involved in cell wall biosynthesis
MKSIFFLSLMNGTAWGGSEEIWYRTALWMCYNNFKVAVGCFEWEEKKSTIQKLQEAGCTVYLLPNKKGLFKNLAVKNVLKQIPFSKYNCVVINQGGWEDVLHGPFKNLFKKLPNYVLLSHNFNENATLGFFKKKLLQQWIQNAQMNFGATEKIFELIENKFKVEIKNKAILINPITFLPDAKPNNFPEFTNDTSIWVMLAELDTSRKAQDVLINTLSSSKWIERNWQLHLYGKGKDEEKLQKLIKKCGLENKVFLKGYTANVKQTLKECHLLLQCTRVDAMPLSVVEAMAMARLCVVTNLGDMPVWINDGENGFVCNDLTEIEIDCTLENCWLQKNKWPLIGQNAFDTFTKKYPQPYEKKIADILENYFT